MYYFCCCWCCWKTNPYHINCKCSFIILIIALVLKCTMWPVCSPSLSLHLLLLFVAVVILLNKNKTKKKCHKRLLWSMIGAWNINKIIYGMFSTQRSSCFWYRILAYIGFYIYTCIAFVCLSKTKQNKFNLVIFLLHDNYLDGI